MENKPIGAKVLSDLNEFRLQTSKLFEAFSQVSRSSSIDAASTLKPRREAIQKSLMDLQDSLTKLDAHRKQEAEIYQANQALLLRAQKLKELGKVLSTAEMDLKKSIDLATKLVPSTSTKSTVPLDWVLQSARKLSFVTRAPAGRFCPPTQLLHQDWALPPNYHYSSPTAEEMSQAWVVRQALKRQGIQYEEEDEVTFPNNQGEKEGKIHAAMTPAVSKAPEHLVKRARVEEEEEDEEDDDFLEDFQ